jgi:acetyl-CoA synthetase
VHIFTSGTTGSPKGVIHPLKQAAGWHSYLVYGLGVTADDVYWCAADPGWAYGLYSGIVAPLALGSGVILQCASFDPVTAWELIEREGVSNLTAAPTVYRAFRNRFATVPSKAKLRRLSSAGEPLTPEVNVWANAQLGLDVHDHFGQTEVGMVFANAHHPAIGREVVRGSMGHPLPGWEAIVIGEDDADEKPVGAVGRVAIDVANSTAMTFQSYQDPARPLPGSPARAASTSSATWDTGTRRAHSTSRPAMTMSSSWPATGSARLRSNPCSASIPRSPRALRSRLRMRTAARCSRRT